MSSIKEQMEAARDLIKAKRYSEARAILQRIDHPKAQEWLARVNELDPPAMTGDLFSSGDSYTSKSDEDDFFPSFTPDAPKRTTGETRNIGKPLPTYNQPATNNNNLLTGILAGMFTLWVIIPLGFMCLCIMCCAGFTLIGALAPTTSTTSGSCPGADCDLAEYNAANPRGAVQFGSPVNGNLSDTNEIESWTLQVSNLSPITIHVTSPTFDEEVHVYGPAGRNLASDDDVFDDGGAVITFTPPVAGTYTIVVTEWVFVFDGGNYTLTVTQ